MSFPIFGELIEEDPFEIFGEEIEEEPSTSKKIGSTAKQFGKSSLTGALGSYGDILDLVGLLPEKTLTPGQEALYKAEFSASEKDLPSLQDEDILPRYTRFPKSSEVSERIGEQLPENASVGERYAQRIGRTVGGGASLAASPGSLAALGGASAIGQTAKEMGAPEWAATILELLSTFGPAAIAKNIVKGKDAKRFIEFARSKNLNDSEISALLQGEKKLKSLAKLANKSGKTERILSSIEQKAGGALDSVKKEASQLPRLTGEQSEALGEEFGNIIVDLNKTLKPSPDKQSVINFIQDAHENLMNKGATIEELINFYQDINAAGNWNAIRGGKKTLARLKQPIKDAISASNPKLGEQFELANTLYSRSRNLAKTMKPEAIDKFLDKGPLGTIAVGLVLGIPGLLSKYMGAVAARSLATELLFNPRLQNISRKVAKAINDDKPKAVQTFMNAFRKELKEENPDLYEELEEVSFE